MKQVEIDGVVYLPCEDRPTYQIVVCQRGFVFVGQVIDTENEVVIHGAQNVRRWGTTKGLGQLASDGPTDKTVLDPSGTVRIHPLTIVVRYDCVADRWNGV